MQFHHILYYNMPIFEIKQIDGMRRTPSRVFPPNGVQYAKNVITSVEDSIFQTASPLQTLFLYTDIATAEFYTGIINHFEGTETIFLIIQLTTGEFHFAYYNGSLTDLGSINTEADVITLLNVGDSIFAHPFGDTFLLLPTQGRDIYKKWKYTRNNIEVENTQLWTLPQVPAKTDMITTVDVFDSTSMTDDIPVVLTGKSTGRYYIMPGYQMNGYESIAFENVNTISDTALVLACIRVSLTIMTSTSKLVNAIDIYVGEETGFPVNPSQMIENWVYADSIPFDRDEIVVDSVACTVLLKDITCGTKTWIVDQWKDFVAKIGGSYYRIDSNTATVLTVATGTPAGSTVEIYSRWIQEGTSLKIAKYITSTEGETLFDRCGVSNLIVKSIYDYCPVAQFIEYFKGFVWMADYVDHDDVRHRNRLISNVVNSEGQSCYNVYNTTIYIEFGSNILGLIRFYDYMLVLTGDGLYTVRFTPSQSISAYSWSVKKISDVKIASKNYVSGTGNIAYLFDNFRLYMCDGYELKLLTNDEISLILDDYTNSTSRSANAYSIFYCEEDANIYLSLDSVVLFRGGVIEVDPINPDPAIGTFIGVYKGEPVYFSEDYIRVIRLYSNKFATSFDVKFHNTDLNTKEDKYFVQAFVRVVKGTIGNVFIETYLDDILRDTVQLDHNTTYDKMLDIRIPKSNTSRFSQFYMRVYGTTSDNDGIDFNLEALDIEIDPIKRTVLA